MHHLAAVLYRQLAYFIIIVQQHEAEITIKRDPPMHMACRFLHPYDVWLLLLFLPVDLQHLGTLLDHGNSFRMSGVRTTADSP